MFGVALNVLRQAIEEDEALAWDMQHMPVRNGFNRPGTCAWSEQERALLSPGIGLMKALRITMRKVCVLVKFCGRCTNMQENADLDAIADMFRTSSSFVEHFITCLHPPIFGTAIQESGTALKECVLAILEATKQVLFCCRTL
ncbi:cyclin-D1-binding protein 1 homolog [Dermacentor silvarum]|nr:cyclin-D1-binding protein 1 homolog [Dermacentor silvarum]